MVVLAGLVVSYERGAPAGIVEGVGFVRVVGLGFGMRCLLSGVMAFWC